MRVMDDSKKKFLVVNFKNYPTSTSLNAIKLAKICEEESKKAGVEIIICPSIVDLENVRKFVGCKVFSQHIDTQTLGKSTGRIVPELIKNIGAEGSLINHSEHKLDMSMVKETINRAKQVGLTSLACAPTPFRAKWIARYSPDMLAVEPPELIGGKVSVSTAKPGIISNTVKKVKKVANIPVLCGAGVQNAQDVKKALELGADGVLIASAITTALDQRTAVKEILKGYQ